MEEEIQQTDGYTVTLLDQGGFGKVYLGKKNNEIITIKILKEPSSDQINSLRKEAEILKRLRHDNIISIIEIQEQLRCIYEDNTYKYMVGILTEYADLGSLAYFRKPFSEGLCRYLLKQLLSGLQHLVDNGICHRDIKPGNLVLNSQYILKIIDFGLACENQNLQLNCGTTQFKAPEVGVDGRVYDGEKVDVFAAGITLFDFYLGTKPFSQKQYEQNSQNENFLLFLKNQQGEFWTKIKQQHQRIKISNAFISLIEGMLNPNPHQRFTVQQCLNHEWMQGTIPVQQLVILEFEQNQHRKPSIPQQRCEKKIVQMRGDEESSSEEDLNYIKKELELNFENLKIKTSTLENRLNFYISNLNPEKLILQLINKKEELEQTLGFEIKFEMLSKKTYSAVFKMLKDYEIIGRIQIDLYKLENDLIGVNIIKLEGDFDDYLEAKLALEQLLEQLENKEME